MTQTEETASLTIGKLAAAGGVGVETIRFYQRRGLLEQPPRERGFRHYGSEDVRRLHFVRQAQTAGFTLAQIKELIDLDSGEDRRRVRQLARERMAALDLKVAELKRARSALQRLASECSQRNRGPVSILTIFEVRAKRSDQPGPSPGQQ